MKKRYQQFAKCYHPDVSAVETTEQMQFINNEYERLKAQFVTATTDK